MQENLLPIVQMLEKECNAVSSVSSRVTSLVIPLGNTLDACQRIVKAGFEILATMTAVDYWPQDNPRFHVIYEFLSVSKNIRLEVRVPLPGINPVIPTITHLYAGANWHERELWDLFGIKAEGHPDLRRILMPADWQGHPLRKDYPLDYEEPQFSFNFEEINHRKPYAKE